MPSKQPVTVLVVDDQATFRRTARRLIAAMPGFEQVGEAASGGEALELAEDLHPDLVLVDVRMPGMDGVETARRLNGIDPDAMVVLISLDELPEQPSSEGSSGVTSHLRKQDLSVRTLLAQWSAHRPAS